MKKIIIFLNVLIVGTLLYLFYSPMPMYVADTTYTPPEHSVRSILFTGDIMLGRYVETLQKSSHLDPFGDTVAVLKNHTTISNLEGPIPLVHKPTPVGGFSFSFPSSTPEYLEQHGVAAVSLANNHSLDQGVSGYEETKYALDQGHIPHFGSYSTTVPEYFKTTLGTTTVIIYGINMISSTWDEKTAFETTRLLRREYPSAYLVAFIHWGNEYDLAQSTTQQTFAHTLVDEGVETIVGSHPHVIQGVEVYKNAPIFYSLGNFIFDQYFSDDVQRGYFVSIDTKDNHRVFTLIPITSVRSQAMFADPILSQTILDTIAKNSPLPIQKYIKNGEFTVEF